jgi:dTDP-4-dehydrorhamnose 3,5-epimerase-like enzyme
VAERIEFYTLPDEGDKRGSAWQVGEAVDFLDAIEDVHLMTLEPGCVRGNHFHRDKREILVIRHVGRWALHWDDGPETSSQRTVFAEPGAVAITVPPNCAHAIVNLGGGTMQVFSFSDRRYDPAAPDSHRRELVRVD